MDSFTIDVSRLGNIDVLAQKEDVTLPRKQAESNTERVMVDSGLAAASLVSDAADLLLELRDIGRAARHIPMHLRGGGHLFALASSPDFTVGIGPSGAAFLGVGVSMSAGIYASTVPELGFYGGGGVGMWTDFGVSVGYNFTVVKGPASVFGGTCWSVGCDMDVPGVSVGVGGALLLAPSPSPPFKIIGVSFSLAAGVSVLPASVNVQAQTTRLHRVI